MRIKKITAAVVFACLALLAHPLLASADWWENPQGGGALEKRVVHPDWAARVNWSQGFIEVVARGAASLNKQTNQAQAESRALKAARLLAYAKLLETVSGGDLVAAGPEAETVKTRISGVVKGARVVWEAARAGKDGAVTAVVRIILPLTGKGGLGKAYLPDSGPMAPRAAPFRPALLAKRSETASAAASPPAAPADAAKKPPVAKEARPEKENGRHYTSLIILAAGIGARPALFPKVLEAGSRRLVYGPRRVDQQSLISRGVTGYAASLERALRHGRAGDWPLVVRATAVVGPGHSNYLISYLDAVRVYAADLRGDFLKRGAVIIVIQ